ncbi:hypothetical protein FRZ67_13405 [Panacibacter ginsenosidivorans]|uniref:Uncharacterized protein n=1 Tax=Panacibacter ginsenosidivorans TaxID=1813871 RepID=A0A5B8VAT7_9BACT|nr:hypothetical protein [Panacibacter ginsenosidivorans]QEC68245.1 hypothetical protein FRZ67_13405 [Panacibacter ginsenosidivorans]
MKPILISIALIFVAYHAIAQGDSTNKKIAVKDSLHSSVNIFMGKSSALSNGYYIHFPSDTMQDYKRMPLFFYDNTYQGSSSTGLWNTAGSLLISFLAEKTRHQYFYLPPK